MTITQRPELIRRFAHDFTALQEAVLTRMNGICVPEIAAALEHASLAGPITVALAHADVLARGAVRHAELAAQPPERLRWLRAHTRKVRRARSQAEAVYKEQRARRRPAGRSRPVDMLELRVARMAAPAAFADGEESLAKCVGRFLMLGPRNSTVRWRATAGASDNRTRMACPPSSQLTGVASLKRVIIEWAQTRGRSISRSRRARWAPPGAGKRH